MDISGNYTNRLNEAGMWPQQTMKWFMQYTKTLNWFEIMRKLKPINTQDQKHSLRNNSKQLNFSPSGLLYENVQRDFNGRTSGSVRELQVHRTSWTRSGGDQRPAGSCHTESRYP